MISLLRNIILPLDESFSPAEKAVFVFLESVAFALAWGGIDRLLVGTSLFIVIPIFAASILISYSGFAWPKVKQKISGSFTRWIERIATSFRFKVTAVLVVSLVAVTYLSIFMHSLRADLDDLIGRREVTEIQKKQVRDYLASREASAVSIQVIQKDDEAMGYAAQLWDMLRDTTWDIDPPNHGGPNYYRTYNPIKKPTPGDLDATGKPRYKNFGDYMNAYDGWLLPEISDQIADRNPDITGLCIYVRLTGQPANPDPRHPTPEAILRDALHAADIDVNCSAGMYDRDKYELLLVVGHRPRGQTSTRAQVVYKLSRWIQGLAH